MPHVVIEFWHPRDCSVPALVGAPAVARDATGESQSGVSCPRVLGVVGASMDSHAALAGPGSAEYRATEHCPLGHGRHAYPVGPRWLGLCASGSWRLASAQSRHALVPGSGADPLNGVHALGRAVEAGVGRAVLETRALASASAEAHLSFEFGAQGTAFECNSDPFSSRSSLAPR